MTETDEKEEEQAEPENAESKAPDLGEERTIADQLDLEEPEEEPEEAEPEESEESSEVKTEIDTDIFAIRTTANREDQVMGFVTSNADKKEIPIYSVIRPHGMRGYIFMEARSKEDAERAINGIPYARGVLDKQVDYEEIEHMLEQVQKEINIKKNDIVEIISGAFKREKAKVTRVDKSKEEVVVELLEAAVPIPITLNIDSVKVIRRPGEKEEV